MKNVKYVLIPQEIYTRKYSVDEPGLKKILKEHKRFNNRKISELLNVKQTTVEHWFRNDNYFCVPDPDNWIKLKALLEINEDRFDKSIMTLECHIGTYEKAERVYLITGISPCLLASGVESILV